MDAKPKSQPPQPNPPADPRQHQLVLVKKTDRWVFRYAPGEESAVLRRMAQVASDPGSGFNWFDAAVLSHQMGGNMHKQLKDLLTDSPNAAS